MVVEYADIFTSVDEKIPAQDWYTPAWRSSANGDTIKLYRDDWRSGDELEAYFYSYGEGEDPEQHPVILEIRLSEVLGNRVERMEELEERIQDALKPLIGWKLKKEGEVFARKELPSDPLTLSPRLLEEFKKLEPIAYRIDQMLGHTEEEQQIEV